MLVESRDFTSDLKQLCELRRFVRECGERIWTEKSAVALEAVGLAVQEAATNIILHAYQREPGRPIHATVRGDAERLEITLTHEGCDFDPAALPSPSFSGERTSGFGVYLIRELMDEVCYLHGQPGCGIVMTKRRTLDPTEETNDESAC